MNKKIITLENNENDVYQGILNIPDSYPDSKPIVMLLPAGLKNSNGPHNLNVQIAKHLYESNIASCRIDPKALGESTGKIENGFINDIYNTISKGKFIDDYCEIISLLRLKGIQNRFILCGLCGGALTSQFVAAKLPEDVIGAIQLGTAITLDTPSNKAPQQLKSPSHLDNDFYTYVKKLTNIKSLLRLLSGKSDFKEIFTTVFQKIQKIIFNKKALPENINKKFLSTLDLCAKNKTPILFVYGENDAYWFEFKDYVLNSILKNKNKRQLFTIHTINNSNHTYYSIEWQEELLSTINKWLLENNEYR